MELSWCCISVACLHLIPCPCSYLWSVAWRRLHLWPRNFTRWGASVRLLSTVRPSCHMTLQGRRRREEEWGMWAVGRTRLLPMLSAAASKNWQRRWERWRELLLITVSCLGLCTAYVYFFMLLIFKTNLCCLALLYSLATLVCSATLITLLSLEYELRPAFRLIHGLYDVFSRGVASLYDSDVPPSASKVSYMYFNHSFITNNIFN